MPTKSIAVPDALYERVRQIAAAEGKTVDQLATKAIERDLPAVGLTAPGGRAICGALT
jgi:hypothetical protein